MKNLLVPILELIKGKYAPYILGGYFLLSLCCGLSMV